MNVLRNNSGQSTSEYILIIVLVVIAVIISLHLFGSSVKSKFFNAGDSVKDTDSIASGTNPSSPGPGPGGAGGNAQNAGGDYGTGRSQDFLTPYFGNEEALEEFKAEQKKAWFKTILVFAVAGAVLLMLVFMTLERIKVIKKQMKMQQEMDDIGRGRSRRPITFKRPLKPKD